MSRTISKKYLGVGLAPSAETKESEKRILSIKSELFGHILKPQGPNRKKSPTPFSLKGRSPMLKSGILNSSNERHLPSGTGNFSYEYALRSDSLKDSGSDYSRSQKASRLHSESQHVESTYSIFPELNTEKNMKKESLVNKLQPQKPIKTIEIILSEDQKDLLPIFADSDPLKVAQDFCKRWELEEDENIIGIIESTVQQEKEKLGFPMSSPKSQSLIKDSHLSFLSPQNSSKNKKPIFSEYFNDNPSPQPYKKPLETTKKSPSTSYSSKDSYSAAPKQSPHTIPIYNMDYQPPEPFARSLNSKRQENSKENPAKSPYVIPIKDPNAPEIPSTDYLFQNPFFSEQQPFKKSPHEPENVFLSQSRPNKSEEESYRSPDFTRNFDGSRSVSNDSMSPVDGTQKPRTNEMSFEVKGGFPSNMNNAKASGQSNQKGFDDRISFGVQSRASEQFSGVFFGGKHELLGSESKWAGSESERFESMRGSYGQSSQDTGTFKYGLLNQAELALHQRNASFNADNKNTKYDRAKVAKIFDVLDSRKRGRISSTRIDLPFKLHVKDMNLLSDVLSSHTSDEMTANEFFNLLVDIGQYESVLNIFRWLF